MSRYDRDESPDEIRDSGVHRPTESSRRQETSDAKGQGGGSGTSQDQPPRHEIRPGKVRSVHQGRRNVGPLKTAALQKPVPMDAGLPALLLDWRGRCPYNQEQDYVFASLCKGRRSTALALKRDVKPHPTRREGGRNPKARSLARIQTLIRNASERER